MQGKDRKLLNIELGRVSPEKYRELPDSGIVVVLDNVRSAHNVGSVFRTSDSFKVDKVFLCGICPVPPSAEIHKSGLGAEDSVGWEHCEDTMVAVERLRDEEYTIVSVEQTVNSVKLDRFRPYATQESAEGTIQESAAETSNIGPIPSKKYALIFGNEVDGVSQEVVDASDSCLETPQFRMKHTQNNPATAGVMP